MRTMFNPDCRRELLSRLGRLTPDRPAQWGQMTAPQMLAHLGDQMRATLGDYLCAPVRTPLRRPVIRELALYWLPWPKARVKGPPEMFTTQPTTWARDLAGVEALVERFAARGPGGAWPENPLFGPMSGRVWGVFCYRHFEHHLRQFGG
jgi:hypothetical protein